MHTRDGIDISSFFQSHSISDPSDNRKLGHVIPPVFSSVEPGGNKSSGDKAESTR
jgi:hypothetical protein